MPATVLRELEGGTATEAEEEEEQCACSIPTIHQQERIKFMETHFPPVEVLPAVRESPPLHSIHPPTASSSS